MSPAPALSIIGVALVRMRSATDGSRRDGQLTGGDPAGRLIEAAPSGGPGSSSLFDAVICLPCWPVSGGAGKSEFVGDSGPRSV